MHTFLLQRCQTAIAKDCALLLLFQWSKLATSAGNRKLTECISKRKDFEVKALKRPESEATYNMSELKLSHLLLKPFAVENVGLQLTIVSFTINRDVIRPDDCVNILFPFHLTKWKRAFSNLGREDVVLYTTRPLSDLTSQTYGVLQQAEKFSFPIAIVPRLNDFDVHGTSRR